MAARSSRSFDAILCDVDGVVRLWGDGMEQLDAAYGLPAGTLAAHAFAPHRLYPAITGQVTDEEWRESVAYDLATPCGSLDRARRLVKDWSALVGEVDHTVLDLLTAARRHVPVALVSNATTRLEHDLASLGLLDAVDAVVNTARLGVCKPDVRVMRHAAERLGVTPDRCLFVDDSAENVEAARTLGMTGVVYRSPEDLRTALAWLLSQGSVESSAP
ncbi:HAD-IA family hydrolase [Thermasporomyces composti]|jgi:putative hydrolase of the HAD superfamily|uniref:Putative hydrolase of the HAD superfamily n=1 Tax=Thermasporomyces composti TaxID=696763 RepID=A0A3D9V4B5_THECX|nr:HAD-IA family hydrolase [Thermasporomyces composti]REF36578.1 putative hydrolase of the HAD superfamily [Thermasporomyces composti]